MYIEFNYLFWRIWIAFRLKWHRPDVFNFLLLEWVEDENVGILWLAILGVFIGIGYKK